MKKKLCIATYVFGKKYQGFIPLYIYSILKAYPNYSVRIYLDGKINKKIDDVIKKLKNVGDFEVIQNFPKKIGLNKKAKKNNMISRSLRWVFYDEVFSEYEYVYIGDIDIFLCKENKDFCEQHAIHCDYLGLPYSNYFRGEQLISNKDIKTIVRKLIKYGFKETYRMFNKESICIRKLTGLHFIKVEPYFNKIKPLIGSYIQELNLLANKKSKKWNQCYFNDEALLYDIVEESNLGIPPKSKETSQNNMIINENAEKVGYRPHHGLHLGIWRKKISNNNTQIKFVIDSKLYRSYYIQFCNLRETDPLLKEILNMSSPFIKKIISNMDNYYCNNS